MNWRKAKHVSIAVIAIAGLALSGCEKARLDQQVRELCAKDGGIKVYEMVKLPPEKFNKWGQINFYLPDSPEPLGHDYMFEVNTSYSKTGNPSMRRVHYRIVRRSDNVVLGESVSYHRVGGDMPGPWHESSFHCPKDAGDIPFLTQVFVAIK